MTEQQYLTDQHARRRNWRNSLHQPVTSRRQTVRVQTVTFTRRGLYLLCGAFLAAGVLIGCWIGGRA